MSNAAGSLRHPLTRALLVLTFTTGLVDAVSYLELGARCGGVLAERVGDRHSSHVAYALGFEVSLIAIAVIVAAAVDVRPDALSGDAVIALLALAMGVRKDISNSDRGRVSLPSTDRGFQRAERKTSIP